LRESRTQQAAMRVEDTFVASRADRTSVRVEPAMSVKRNVTVPAGSIGLRVSLTRLRKPALQQRGDGARLLDRCQVTALFEHLQARAGHAVTHPLVFRSGVAMSSRPHAISVGTLTVRRSACESGRASIACCWFELALGADAPGHASHQIAQARSMRRVHPARGQLGDESIDAAGLHLRNVVEATLSPGLRIGNRARIQQHQTFDALTLSTDHLECDIAAKRKADQREPSRRMLEQFDGHPTERGVIAKREHAAVMRRTQRIDLVGEQAFVRQMRACEYECRFCPSGVISGVHAKA
jgi:hypothetical protein